MFPVSALTSFTVTAMLSEMRYGRTSLRTLSTFWTEVPRAVAVVVAAVEGEHCGDAGSGDGFFDGGGNLF